MNVTERIREHPLQLEEEKLSLVEAKELQSLGITQMNVTQRIRDHLLQLEEKKLSLAEIRELQIDEGFIEKMKSRLVAAFYRYGGNAHVNNQTNGLRFDQAANAKKKIDAYLETGNTENLVDAACYAMVAYMSDDHPNKHFESQDDSEHATRMENC